MGIYPPIPWTPERERLNRFLHLRDLVFYSDKVTENDPSVDFVGWQFEDGKVLLLYPWVKIYNSIHDIVLWPDSVLRLQTGKMPDGSPDYMPPENLLPKKKWWQFWRRK